MPSFHFLVAVLAWFTYLNTSAVAANVNTTSVPFRIMALGASVTFGVGSTTGDSYRKDLEDLLTSNGNTVQYVGLQNNGNFTDNAVEATPGFVISQIAASANTAVPQLKPNLVLLDAGTNNCNNGGTVPDAGANITALITNIFTQSPGATVILTTILVNSVAAQDACRVTINTQYTALAATLQAGGAKLVLVDMRGPGGPLVTDLADGRHPNDAGYIKMSNIWFQGIQEVISKGFLSTPLLGNTNSVTSSALTTSASATSVSITSLTTSSVVKGTVSSTPSSSKSTSSAAKTTKTQATTTGVAGTTTTAAGTVSQAKNTSTVSSTSGSKNSTSTSLTKSTTAQGAASATTSPKLTSAGTRTSFGAVLISTLCLMVAVAVAVV